MKNEDLWFWRFKERGYVVLENGEVEAKVPLKVLDTILQEVRRR